MFLAGHCSILKRRKSVSVRACGGSWAFARAVRRYCRWGACISAWQRVYLKSDSFYIFTSPPPFALTITCRSFISLSSFHRIYRNIAVPGSQRGEAECLTAANAQFTAHFLFRHAKKRERPGAMLLMLLCATAASRCDLNAIIIVSRGGFKHNSLSKYFINSSVLRSCEVRFHGYET
jgi:hypothetical protein